MSDLDQEAEEILDPTQSRFVEPLHQTEGSSDLAKMAQHLEVTAETLSTITQHSAEQTQHFRGLGSTMRLISLGTTLVALAIIVVVVYLMRDIFALFATAFLIAYMMDPLVSMLERRGANRTLVVAMFSVLLLGIALISSLYLVEMIAEQLKTLADNLPTLVQTLRAKLYEWETILKLWLPSLQNLDMLAQIEDAIGEYRVLDRIVPTAASFGGSVVPLLSGLAIVPFLTFFMLNNGPQIRKSLIQTVPNRYFEPVLVLIHELDLQLGQYIRSRFVETVILSVLAIVGLQVIGIHFAVILGLVLGIANLIPYFGPVLGTIPAALVALSGSHLGDWGFVAVIALSFALQFIDNALIFPLMVGKSVDLGPVSTILVVLIGSEFFGLVGLLLAVPAAAMLKVMVQVVYREAGGYWTH